MPFNKEQRREKRRLAKLGFAIPNQVSHGEVSHNQVSQVELLKVSHKVEPKTANLATANLKEVSHGKPEPRNNGKPKLWSDYYSGKKPFCSGCRQQGIPADQYGFCSLAKDTDPDFKNVYVCQVYH
jgi:hypothetical protein